MRGGEGRRTIFEEFLFLNDKWESVSRLFLKLVCLNHFTEILQQKSLLTLTSLYFTFCFLAHPLSQSRQLNLCRTYVIFSSFAGNSVAGLLVSI